MLRTRAGQKGCLSFSKFEFVRTPLAKLLALQAAQPAVVLLALLRVVSAANATAKPKFDIHTWHQGFGHMTIDDGPDQQARFLSSESKVSGKK